MGVRPGNDTCCGLIVTTISTPSGVVGDGTSLGRLISTTSGVLANNECGGRRSVVWFYMLLDELSRGGGQRVVSRLPFLFTAYSIFAGVVLMGVA